MSALVLVDTSTWTQALRRDGESAARLRVAQLLSNNQAAWCDAVRLELWNGVRGQDERQKLEEMDRTIPRLSITAKAWEQACGLASRARGNGLTVPAVDILIFACAKAHNAGIESTDRHFDMLERLGAAST